jgi:hypothetical protein
VSLLKKMIVVFDAPFSLSKGKLDADEKAFRGEALLRGNATNDTVNGAHDAIDAKSAAILTHVSVMIAVSGILGTQSASSVIALLFVVEMLLYVVLALFCLRLLMMQDILPNESNTFNAVAKETVLELTAKLTFLISIGLVLTVVVELIANWYLRSPAK